MQRFRLLGFYLVGVVAVVGLTVWGVSLRRTAAGAPPSSADASQESPTTATTGAAAANLASAVRNIFSAKCTECHGSDLPRPKGRFGYVLDLERLAGNSHLVVPFKPDESKLWMRVHDEEMPPAYAKAGSLTKEEKEAIRRWIESGSPAVLPGAGGALLPRRKTGPPQVVGAAGFGGSRA
jgi:mono/diheme cytochrome c family protein